MDTVDNTMSAWIIDLGLFFSAVIIHEAAHWFYEYGITLSKPKIKFFRLFNIPIGLMVPIDEKKNTILSKVGNHCFGIGIGTLPLTFLNASEIVWLAYWVACSLDLLSIFGLLLAVGFEPYKRHYSWDTAPADIGCNRCINLTTSELRYRGGGGG